MRIKSQFGWGRLPQRDLSPTARPSETVFSFVRTATKRILRACAALNCQLGNYYRLCERTGFDLPPGEPREVSLEADEILRLPREPEAVRITVLQGTVWLTGSPSDGDVLLSEGEDFQLNVNLPFVLQAVGAATISLAPSGANCTRRP